MPSTTHGASAASARIAKAAAKIDPVSANAPPISPRLRSPAGAADCSVNRRRLDAPTLLRRVLAGGHQLRAQFGQRRRQADEAPG
ncbi:hypothetical protein [Xanthomonas graminis]|uniref:hypothetical protein n=1 Tax=Xanthomonas graminis TaxID=3390026 RepID=UPI0015869EF6|nr:hypothetical protein [Xanthomonas translucens]